MTFSRWLKTFFIQPSPLHVIFLCQGVAQRADLPPHPEPEVAMIFKKSEGDTAVDLLQVEMALRKALQEVGLVIFRKVETAFDSNIFFFCQRI